MTISLNKLVGIKSPYKTISRNIIRPAAYLALAAAMTFNAGCSSMYSKKNFDINNPKNSRGEIYSLVGGLGFILGPVGFFTILAGAIVEDIDARKRLKRQQPEEKEIIKPRKKKTTHSFQDYRNMNEAARIRREKSGEAYIPQELEETVREMKKAARIKHKEHMKMYEQGL